VTGARWASRSAGTPARSRSPVGGRAGACARCSCLERRHGSSRHNRAVIGSGSPSLEMARPQPRRAAGGEHQPHGRGLVICTVQAQDQAPVGSHLLASQVSETTRQSHPSPRHPATAPRKRTTAKMSVIRDDQECGGLIRSTA
jgi:hypothetical protein